MAELREFAQHRDEFDQVKTRIVAISTDGQDLARQTWEKAAQQKLTVLSDPEAAAIKAYGLLDSEGGKLSSKRTLVLVDEQGNQRWQEPAGHLTVAAVVKRIRGTE